MEALNFTLKKNEKHLQVSQKRRAEAEQGAPGVGKRVAPAPAQAGTWCTAPAPNPCRSPLTGKNSHPEKHEGSHNRRIPPHKTNPRPPKGAPLLKSPEANRGKTTQQENQAHPEEFPPCRSGKPVVLHALPLLASGHYSKSQMANVFNRLHSLITWRTFFFPLIGLFWGVLFFIYNYHYLDSVTTCT